MSKLLMCISFIATSLFLGGCNDDNDSPRKPNLSADRIDFAILRRDNLTSGRVRITGVVKNIGADFLSNPGQQAILLYEQAPGAAFPAAPVARLDFETLLAGEELTVQYTREWNSSMQSEFPFDYILMVSLDPDILIDANPDNDDVTPANNTLTVSGSGINTLFANPQ